MTSHGSITGKIKLDVRCGRFAITFFVCLLFVAGVASAQRVSILEESVEKAVRAMNWRPAMRNGSALPMRVLLRYNFTKVEKE